jgi:Domain of unknown function (DUF4349)
MEPFRDDADLIAELRALRPRPCPAFAAELDERAAAGFPRRSAPSRWSLGRLRARAHAVQPRRVLLSAGATALATVAVATAIVASDEHGASSSSSVQLRSPTSSGAVASSSPAGAPVRKSANGVEYEGEIGEARGPVPTAPHDGALSNSAGEAAGSEIAPSKTGPFAASAQHREAEHAAQIVLGTRPTEVHEVANQVLQVVHAYQGIVLRSSIHDVGEADSTFDLLIPRPKLSDALAGFSEAGEVLSRRESSVDVTARTIGLDERLQDAEATVKGLLAQLAAAESDSGREVAEAELQSARQSAANLRSRLNSLQRRVNFSRVLLRIDSKPGAVGGGNADRWGVSSALTDAGQILAIAAGVTIVGLAIAGPIALLALLAWLANRARIRRARQRALA